MRQAITTKYIGPTNTKGSRVKASCQAGSLTLEWNDAYNSDVNHSNAARALANRLGWTGEWFGGFDQDSRGVFVLHDGADAAFHVYNKAA
jgi:hypothetical protein